MRGLYFQRLLSCRVVFLGTCYVGADTRRRITASTRSFSYVDLPTQRLGGRRNLNKRSELYQLLVARSVDKKLAASICDLLPMAVLESYEKLFKSVSPCPGVRILVSSENGSKSFRNDLFLAKSYLEKAHLVLVCHGGAYGMWQVDLQDRVYKRIFDSYLGLPFPKVQSSRQLLPLRFLESKQLRGSKRLSGRLKFGVFLTRNHEDFYSYDSIFPRVPNPTYAIQIEEICDSLLGFGEVRVRDYHGEFEKDANKRSREILESHGVKFDRSDNIGQFLESVDLAIVTYNATVLQELTLAQFPYLAYWDIRYTHCNKVAADFVGVMANYGIFHDSIQSLISRVRHIECAGRESLDNESNSYIRADLARKIYGFGCEYDRDLHIKKWNESLLNFLDINKNAPEIS